jgi:hypothetical protein
LSTEICVVDNDLYSSAACEVVRQRRMRLRSTADYTRQ